MENPLKKGFDDEYAVLTAATVMSATSRSRSLLQIFSCSTLPCRNSFLDGNLDWRSYEHDGDDLDEIAGEEGDDTGGHGGAEGHSGLGHEPGSSENVEDCGGQDHGDEHNGVFKDAGSIPSVPVVDQADNKCHRDVTDDVAAGDAHGDADAACPACEYGNAYAAEKNIYELAEPAELRSQKDS